MASDSSRTRIDQFFSSRKRKPISPGLKSGKDARGKVETSPNVKGNLDNFLVNSPENDKRSQAQRGLLGRHDSLVKRNLALEIDVVSRSYNTEALATTAEMHMPPCEVVEMARKETSQGSSNVADATGKATGKDDSVLVDCGGKSELEQFATDFLSLYCSGLKSTATSPLKPKMNDHKRYGSPLLVDGEVNSSKKRRCISHDLRLEGETACSIEKKTEDMQSAAVVKNVASIFCATGKVAVANDPVHLQGSLRKCNMVTKSTLNTDEFQTPGSMVAKAGVCAIPKSSSRSCGSSLFSPGEAFWNEAILVADGLFDDADNPDAQVTEDIINGCNKSREMLSKDGGRGQQMGHGDSLELIRMRSKNSVKEVSPLPVKHLDFMFEDKNLDISTPCHAAGNTSKCRDGELSECCSANVKGPQTADIATHHSNDQINEGMHQAEVITPVHGVDTREVNLSNQDPDNITSKSPINEIMNSMVNIKYDEAVTPSSLMPFKDQLDLSNWLPADVCSIYKRKGMSKLYPWQVDCLQVDGVLQRRNLVYCASTSAGKSFVAEILMLRRIMTTGKIALLVLPYVSICSEKAEHLEGLLEPLGKNVRSYYGNQGGGTLPKDTSVAVCTIEKANSLVNKLLEEGRLSEIGIIVIDELHMVGDQRRGYLLELLLTKLRYAAGEGNSESSSGESSGTSSKGDPARGLQMVGMSATMPNVAAVAVWLQASGFTEAALYQTDFRPVPLEEFIKIGNTIYNKKMEIVRTIPRAADLGGKDPDHIVELCNEVVQEGHSVLMFCSSRKGCESTAKHVSKFLKKFSAKIQSDGEFSDMASAIDALRRCPVGLDPILEETLPCGVAYHHAGLTVEEREVIETCYRRGLLRVLTATSTLAAGVNLPARRVIFRQPRIGRDFIDDTRYRQMAGRAGRTGIDSKGESVLICKPEELKRIMGLLNERCPPLQSCLSEDKNGMTHAILEVVAGGIVQTADDIHRYVRCILLNSTKPFRDVVKSAQDSLRWLCHRKFLEWNEDTKLYSSTPLGRASFGSSLYPEESLIVLDDLSRAREAFVLASDLHLVYLVTPINVDVEPNWELYYERFMELSALDQSVGNRVGVSEPYLMRMAHGAPMRTLNRSTDNTKGLHGKFENISVVANKNMIADEQILRVCKRFYVALILSRLVQEVPVAEVCEAFKVVRGMVQALQENAGRFASMVSMFCERLGWHDLEGLVARFQNRVSFGVKAEIAELTTIPFVKGSRARALYEAGFRTPLAIAETSIPELVKALFESSSWDAQEGLAQRRLYLGIVKKIKNGACKIVLEKAEEARVAAFSAFKSLGLNVPQFSRPLLPNDSGNLVERGATSNMLGDQTNTIHSVEQKDHASSRLCVEGSVNSEEVSSGSEADKFEKGYNVEQVGPAEVKSNAHKPCHFGAENSTVPSRKCLTPDVGLHDKNADASLSTQLGNNGDATVMHGRTIDSGILEQRNREIMHGEKKDIICEKGPINASSTGGFDSFLDLWGASHEFYFDIHYNKRSGVNSVTPFEIHGIAICWENSPVYYVNLPKDLLWSDNDNSPLTAPGERSNRLPEDCLETARHRWQRIGEIMGKKEVRKFTWNLKVQVQVIKSAVVSIQRASSLNILGKNLGFELIDSSHLLLPPIHIREAIDLCIVAWVLWPDEERSSNPNLEKEVKRRLSSEAVAAANRNGRWKNQTRRVAHNGCCRRVAQTRALCSVLWKLLISEGLVEALMQIEIPLVNVLADMELWGIGVDMEGCLQARNILGKKLRHLEKKAYDLADISFSLSSAADIANVLYRHLKLPVPKAHKKGKQHPSTDKHCLDLLRNEHPIIPVIKEHQTLAKLLNSTLGSICSLARLSMRTLKYTLHGHWLQTSTATGRLSMEEPNLQCVEHMVDFELNMEKSGSGVNIDRYKIIARDFLVPTQDNWLLLSADYSQIEFRLMAHFSQDASLIELLSRPHGDVFTMMAARWTGKPEDSVCPDERDQTKRLVYGILYRMGAKTLAEQLNCNSDEAAERIKSFKSSFPGVSSWLHEAVASCCRKGYVETLKGRKRFLSKIKFGNNEEKSKAQRQAVNSICQGSAADLIKIAMIRIYSVIVEGVDKLGSSSSHSNNFHMLKGRCRILLQVHDELVLEVEPSMIKEAALLLQMSMESAAVLLVPLQVKRKVGRTWGSLEPFRADQYVNDLPVLDS